MALSESSGRDSPPSSEHVKANDILRPINYRAYSHITEEMMVRNPAIQRSKARASVRVTMLQPKTELDEEAGHGTPKKVSQPTEEETTLPPGTSKSDTIESLGEDGSKSNLQLAEEMNLIKSLTRPFKGYSRALYPRRRIKKSIRKRGDSFERAVSLTILQTASAGASKAHFLMETNDNEDPFCKDSRFILNDLIEETLPAKESVTTKKMVSKSSKDNSNGRNHKPVSTESPAQPVETKGKTAPLKFTALSFDSISWDTTDDEKETTQIDASKSEPVRKEDCTTKEDPPVGPVNKKLDPPPEQTKLVLFKANLDDWTPFEGSQMFSSPCKGATSGVATRDSFPVAQPKEASKVPKLSPPPSIKKLFIRPSGATVRTVKTSNCHPRSPSSVCDFRNSGSKPTLKARVARDPEAWMEIKPSMQSSNTVCF